MKNMRPKSGPQAAGIFAVLAALFGLLLLIGCENPLGQAPRDPGVANLALSINDRGRTIMPSMPDGETNFYLEFQALTPGNQTFSRSWAGDGFIELHPGQWNLRVTSYVPGGPGDPDDQGGRRFVARSEWEVITVAPGDNTYSVVLVPMDEGYGRFSWDIDFSPEVVAAQMRVVRFSDPTFYRDFVLAGPGATYLTGYDLPVGLYRVIFTLSGPNGASAEIGKLLHIHRSLESRFTDDEELFADFIFPADLLHTILGAWNEDGWNFDLGDDRRISARHFELLPVNGVNAANFSDMAEQFDLLSTGDNAANRPVDRAGLEAMIDAALVRMAIPGLNRANNVWDRSGGQATIAGLVQNLDPGAVGFAWGTGEEYYSVNVAIGGFEFPVEFVPVAVTGVAIDGPSERSLTIHDEPLALVAGVIPPDARIQGITWEVYQQGGTTAGVSPEGVVSPGTAAGVAVIRARSVGSPDLYAQVTVNVSTDVVYIEDLAIYNADFVLNVGEYEDLELVFTPANTTQRAVAVTLSAGTVGVDWEEGRLRVRGLAVGQATVTVTSGADDTLYDTVNVTVIAIPTGVEVSPASANVPMYGTRQFDHLVLGPDGVTQTVSWSIYPESAGSISGGLLTLGSDAEIEGTVTVTATVNAHGATEYGSATVTVLPPVPTGIVIDQGAQISLERDDHADPNPRFQFSASVEPEGAPDTVVWSIVPTVPTVPTGAHITPAGALATAAPLGPGSTFTVRAQVYGHPGVYAEIQVTVNVSPTGVTITSPASPATIVRGGQPLSFAASVQPAGAPANVQWEVDPMPEGVTMINGTLAVAPTTDSSYQELTVRARVPGTAIVSTPVTVNVTVLPESVEIVEPSPTAMYRGDTQRFHAVVYPPQASQLVQWAVYPESGSFDGDYLTISGTASVSDTVTVTATAMGTNESTTWVVAINAPPATGISITPPTANVTRGGPSQQFEARIQPSAALQFAYWEIVGPIPAGVSLSTAAQNQTVDLIVASNADVSHGDTLTIRARTPVTNHTAEATVTITVAPTGFLISPNTATMIRGGPSRTFTATVQPAGAQQQMVEWSIDPPNAATIIPAADGSATVSVTGEHNQRAFTVRAVAVAYPTAVGTAPVNVQEQGDFEVHLPDFPAGEVVDIINLPAPIELLEGPHQVTVEVAERYQNVRWFFDGQPIRDTVSDTESYVSPDGVLHLGPRIHGDLLSVGEHFLTVEVTLNGEPRSRRIVFRVEL